MCTLIQWQTEVVLWWWVTPWSHAILTLLRGTDSGFWDPEHHTEEEKDKEAGEECKKMYLQKIDMHKKTAHEVLDDWLQLQQQRYAVIWVNGSWNCLQRWRRYGRLLHLTGLHSTKQNKKTNVGWRVWEQAALERHNSSDGSFIHPGCSRHKQPDGQAGLTYKRFLVFLLHWVDLLNVVQTVKL